MTLTGSNVTTMHGTVYDPYGKLSLTGSGSSFDGLFEADTINLTGSNLTFTGEGASGTPTSPYTIGSAATPPILPTSSASGATPLNLTFSNPNSDTVQVSSLTVAITSITDPHGHEISQLNGGSGTCNTSNYQLQNYSGSTFQIPVGSSSLQSLSIPQSQWPSVRWVNDPVHNQDACEQDTLHFSFTGSP